MKTEEDPPKKTTLVGGNETRTQRGVNEEEHAHPTRTHVHSESTFTHMAFSEITF